MRWNHGLLAKQLASGELRQCAAAPILARDAAAAARAPLSPP